MVTAVPYPTPHRLALADEIARGETIGVITARVAELANYGLVEVSVRLTPDGMAWVTRARTGSDTAAKLAKPAPDSRCRVAHEHDDHCHEAPLADEPELVRCTACNGIGENWITASTSVPCHCEGGYERVEGPVSTSPETGPGAVLLDEDGCALALPQRSPDPGLPRFEPDAELVVDMHNGLEQWTGAEWNDYVARAERGRNMVTARLVECPQSITRAELEARTASPETGPALPWPDFNPAYRVVRCGQLSAHGPHVMEHGPDRPRNCPGTGRATWDAWLRWAEENQEAVDEVAELLAGTDPQFWEDVENAMPRCQPIGCDAGIHLPGCPVAEGGTG